MHPTVHAEWITLDIRMNDDSDTSCAKCAKFGRPCEKFVTRFTQKKMAGAYQGSIIIWAFGERS